MDGGPELLSEHATEEAVAGYRGAFASGLPFPHLRVRNLLPDAFLERVKRELLEHGEYQPKNNDLYTFRQSKDLRTIDSGAVRALTALLYGERFRAWIQSVTGVEVNDTVDMSSAVYGRTDHLLCHDDDLASRRIAYILYLVPRGWAPADGGALDLYDCDADGAPRTVAASLVPEWNSMAFFAVHARSHHQVAEVTAADKGPRMSISGWFHGRPVARPPPRPLPAPPAAAPLANGTDLARWIDVRYLDPATVAAVRAQFRAECAIELPGFLRPERYAAAAAAAQAQPWRHRGPANIRHHKVSDAALCLVRPPAERADAACAPADAANGTLPDDLARLTAFLCGQQFAEYVAAVTGARPTSLSALARCFAHRDYTMIADPQYREQRVKDKQTRVAGGAPPAAAAAGAAGGHDPDADAAPALDITLCTLPPFLPPLQSGADEGGEGDAGGGAVWHPRFGGCVTYMTEDEELMTVVPRANTLSLVLREPGVLSFVKYVNALAPCPRTDVALECEVEAAEEYDDDDDDGVEEEEEEEEGTEGDDEDGQ